MQRAAQGDGPSGMFLAGGIAAALLERERTGNGVVVDVSLLAGAVWTMAPDLVGTSVLGAEPSAVRRRPLHEPAHRPVPHADQRWLMLNMMDGARTGTPACRAFGFDDWVGRPHAERPDHRDPFTTRSRGSRSHDWEARLRAEGCIFAKMATPPEVLDDVQVTTLDYLPRHPVHAVATPSVESGAVQR